jgi:hypothetical protein
MIIPGQTVILNDGSEISFGPHNLVNMIAANDSLLKNVSKLGQERLAFLQDLPTMEELENRDNYNPYQVLNDYKEALENSLLSLEKKIKTHRFKGYSKKEVLNCVAYLELFGIWAVNQQYRQDCDQTAHLYKKVDSSLQSLKGVCQKLSEGSSLSYAEKIMVKTALRKMESIFAKSIPSPLHQKVFGKPLTKISKILNRQ